MANLGDVTVKLTADTAEFEKAMSGARDQLATVAKTATVAFAGLAAGIGVSVAAASKQIEAELQLASAFKATGKAINTDRIKALASELQKVTTFGDETTIAAAAMFARFGAGEQAVLKLLPRLQDMSAAMGVDLKTSVLTVGKAFAGQAGALSRYGVVLSDAEKKVIESGTSQQRLAVLVEALDKRFAGAAQTMAQTAAGAAKQLNNAFGDLLEQFGFLVDQPLASIMGMLNKALSSLSTIIAGLSPETKKWVGIITLGATAFAGLTAAIAGVALAMPAITAGLAAIAGVTGPVLLALLGVAAAVSAIIVTVGFLKRAWDKNLGGIQERVQWWKEEFVAAFNIILAATKTVTKFFLQGWQWTIESVIKLWNKFDSMVSGAIDNIVERIEKLVDGFGELLGLDIEKLDLGRAAGAFQIDVSGGEQALARLDALFDEAKVKAGEAAAFVMDEAAASWDEGVEVFKGILGGLSDSLGFSFDGIKEKMAGTTSQLGDFSGKLAKAAAGTDEYAFVSDSVSDSLLNMAKQIPGIGGAIATATDALRSLSPSMAKAFDEIDDAVGELFEAIDPVIKIFSMLIETVASGIRMIGEFINAIVAAIGPLLDFAGSILGAVGDILGGIGDAFSDLADWITGAGESFSDIIEEIRDGELAINENSEAVAENTEQMRRNTVGAKKAEKIADILENAAKKGMEKVEDARRKALLPLAIEEAKARLAAAQEDLRASLEAGKSGARANANVEQWTAALNELELEVLDDFKALNQEALTAIEAITGLGMEGVGQEFIEFFTRASDTFRSLVGDMGFISEELFKSTLGMFAGPQAAEILTAMGFTVEGFENLTETMGELNQELTNVPEGFKIALRRFQATEADVAQAATGAEGGVGPMRTVGGQQLAGQAAINIEQLIVQANNTNELREQLEEESQWSNVVAKGTPVLTAPTFATANTQRGR
jgi:hypothetical protein